MPSNPVLVTASEVPRLASELHLWVDDAKPEPFGCAVARTYDDAVSLMRRFAYPVLYLDHDLGEPRTGYDLLAQALAEGICPPRVECISWNPVGRKRINDLLAERKLPTRGPDHG